jgi:hypothetical protein
MEVLELLIMGKDAIAKLGYTGESLSGTFTSNVVKVRVLLILGLKRVKILISPIG